MVKIWLICVQEYTRYVIFVLHKQRGWHLFLNIYAPWIYVVMGWAGFDVAMVFDKIITKGIPLRNYLSSSMVIGLFGHAMGWLSLFSFFVFLEGISCSRALYEFFCGSVSMVSYLFLYIDSRDRMIEIASLQHRFVNSWLVVYVAAIFGSRQARILLRIRKTNEN